LGQCSGGHRSAAEGIIAHAALERGKAIRENLEILSHHPLVKGVRRNLQANRLIS